LVLNVRQGQFENIELRSRVYLGVRGFRLLGCVAAQTVSVTSLNVWDQHFSSVEQNSAFEKPDFSRVYNVAWLVFDSGVFLWF
jgi:hypothetical protein